MGRSAFWSPLSFATHVPNLLLFHNLWRAVFCGQVTQIPTILLPFCSYQGCIWPRTQIRSQKDHSWKTGSVEERAAAASVLIALNGTWCVVAVGMCAVLFFCELPKLFCKSNQKFLLAKCLRISIPSDMHKTEKKKFVWQECQKVLFFFPSRKTLNIEKAFHLVLFLFVPHLHFQSSLIKG